MNWKTWLRSIWAKGHNNPWFVAFYMSFGVTVGAQVNAWLETGVFNWSPHYWVKTAVAAALAATMSVYHLKLFPAKPTMAATFPPSQQIEQVLPGRNL